MKAITALKTYFGMQPDQTLSGFMDEVKALKAQCEAKSPGDYQNFCDLVAKELGQVITEV